MLIIPIWKFNRVYYVRHRTLHEILKSISKTRNSGQDQIEMEQRKT